MTKASSVVEVNGNRYDAITGKLIGTLKKGSSANSRTTGRSQVDGFVLPHKRPPSPQKTANPSRQKVDSRGLHKHHEKTQTLMRGAVKKPSTMKIIESSGAVVKQTPINHVRQSRAKTATKHSAVNRFGFFRSSARPDTAELAASPSKPTLKTKRVTQSEAVPPATPSMITSVSHQKLERLLDEALVKASSHKQMMGGDRPKRQSRLRRVPKKLSISLAVIVFTALAAFLIWQNLPIVAVHVAAARAHVKASMPGYTPNGYSFANPIKYENGTLTMKYIDKNHAGDNFLLTQKASNWSSSSLAANSLPKDASIQTSQVNGTTVYIYGDSNDATWVNHGTLYNLKNKAKLNSDQVMKIVQSL